MKENLYLLIIQGLLRRPRLFLHVPRVWDQTHFTLLAQMSIHPECHMGSRHLVENQKRSKGFICMWRGWNPGARMAKHLSVTCRLPLSLHPLILSFFPSAQSCLTLHDPRTVARQAPLSMRFPRQEHWRGTPFPSPGDLPDAGICSISCTGRQILYPRTTWEALLSVNQGIFTKCLINARFSASISLPHLSEASSLEHFVT